MSTTTGLQQILSSIIIVNVGLFTDRWEEEWMGTKLISQFASLAIIVLIVQ